MTQAPEARAAEFVSRRRPFRAHRLLWSGHLQTIFGSQQRRVFPWGWRESSECLLPLASGAVIRYRWAETAPRAPSLILVHGMAGSSRSGYMLALSHKAYRLGWNSVLLDLYNVNSELDKPRIFHAGSSEDLSEMVLELLVRHSLAQVVLLGISMGGNILLKTLGEWGDQVPRVVRAAATISPLVDLTKSWRLLDEPLLNRLYRYHYVSRLCKRVLASEGRYRDIIDVDRLRAVRSIREFDEVVTVPLGGFEGVDDYYRKASAFPLLDRIELPTLLLHSKDDPLLPWTPLADPGVGLNSALTAWLTDKGGHVAYIERDRIDWDRSWGENTALGFLRLFVE